MTNFDKEMQEMTVEDLASLKSALYAVTLNLCGDCPLNEFCQERYDHLLDSDEDCYDVWVAYLKSEVDTSETEERCHNYCIADMSMVDRMIDSYIDELNKDSGVGSDENT